MRRESGFSLIELLITMVIMGFVIAAGSDMFVGMVRGYRQQSKITETNIGGVVGLDILRRDIESAGYGLPWLINPGITYTEVDPASNIDAAAYNDDPDHPPRPLLSGVDGNNRAYLVLKAVNLARNDTCSKWTYLLDTGGTTAWTTPSANFVNTERVSVISPGATASNNRTLVGYGTFAAMTATTPERTEIVYGVDPDTNLIMPFNRADYYVRTASGIIPNRCAKGTGVLVKAVVSQGNGTFMGNTLPILDCVADMQVVTYLDTSGDGQWDLRSNGVNLGTAEQIRDQLKEVHVYILTHEGQRDSGYAYPSNTVLVGESAALGLGRDFHLDTLGDPNWRNYRWKVYTLVVTPNNLR